MSLTKNSRATDAGIELLALIESATADGRLSDSEIYSLKSWADHYADCGLPAHAHLSATIKKVVEDGIVTRAERDDVYAAIEDVLPPDLRRGAKERRRAAEDAEHLDPRNQPSEEFDFMLAGVSHHRRWQIIEASVRAGDLIHLVRDPKNHYSRRAVRVVLDSGDCIGFVPERHADAIAKALDAGGRPSASVKKILDRGRYPIPVIFGEIYPSNTARELSPIRSDWNPEPEEKPFEPPPTGTTGITSTLLLITAVTIIALIAVALILR